MNRYRQTVLLYLSGGLNLGLGFAFHIDPMFWGGAAMLYLPLIAGMWNEHQHINPDPTVPTQ